LATATVPASLDHARGHRLLSRRATGRNVCPGYYCIGPTCLRALDRDSLGGCRSGVKLKTTSWGEHPYPLPKSPARPRMKAATALRCLSVVRIGVLGAAYAPSGTARATGRSCFASTSPRSRRRYANMSVDDEVRLSLAQRLEYQPTGPVLPVPRSAPSRSGTRLVAPSHRLGSLTSHLLRETVWLSCLSMQTRPTTVVTSRPKFPTACRRFRLAQPCSF